MKIRITSYAALALAGAFTVISAAKLDAVVLASYTFVGQDGHQVTTSASSVVSGVSVSSISRGAAYGSSTVSSPFTNDSMSFSPGLSTLNTAIFIDTNYSASDAVANNGYFEVTIAPEAGRTISIDSIFMGIKRASSSSGANNLEVRSSLDGFTSALSTANSTAGTTLSISFAGLLQDLDESITLRFYGYGRNRTPFTSPSNSSYGILSIGNATNGFEINGSVSAIPEPQTYAFGLGALSILFSVIMRRRCIK